MVLQAHRQSPRPRHLRKRTRSQGPFLSQRCPASTVIRPRPTPAMAAAIRDVEAATLALDGSPPIARTTFPTCRAHYPGGSSGCTCRLLPRSCCLPLLTGGSASALSLSMPAQASLTLRPAGLLNRLKAAFVTRLQPCRLPGRTARQLPDQSTTLWVESSSTSDPRLRGALPRTDIATNLMNSPGAVRADPTRLVWSDVNALEARSFDSLLHNAGSFHLAAMARCRRCVPVRLPRFLFETCELLNTYRPPARTTLPRVAGLPDL
jgi:hypothetical protein